MFGLISVRQASVKDRFNEAKLLIERHGWCQNLFCSKKDNEITYCLLGAMFTVEQDNEKSRLMLERFCKANSLENTGHGNYFAITKWNDKVGRTKKDVIKAFDKAINYGSGK